MNYSNLVVETGCTLDTHGYLVNVAGTLVNNGTITDTYSGGSGGAGGDGGSRGTYWEDSLGFVYGSHPGNGECGGSGGSPLVPQAGAGGDGGRHTGRA